METFQGQGAAQAEELRQKAASTCCLLLGRVANESVGEGHPTLWVSRPSSGPGGPQNQGAGHCQTSGHINASQEIRTFLNLLTSTMPGESLPQTPPNPQGKDP